MERLRPHAKDSRATSLDSPPNVLKLRGRMASPMRRAEARADAGMSGFFDVYSIIFLIIAVVIFMRLGSVLGRRTGNEPSPYEPRVKTPATGARNDNVVALPPRERGPAQQPESLDLEPLARHAAPGRSLHDGRVAIAKTEPGFDPEHFIVGAKAAYEMIVTAFAQGDRATLKNLLAPDVYDGFVSAIAAREAEHQKAELTFVGIEEAKMTAAGLEGRTARISVRFISELITCTRDREGKVVEGDPTEVQTIRDSWTFARDVNARDPNWKLVATEAV
jgi:predicted lipid-binding transport protein (Tim44 family)